MCEGSRQTSKTTAPGKQPVCQYLNHDSLAWRHANISEMPTGSRTCPDPWQAICRGRLHDDELGGRTAPKTVSPGQKRKVSITSLTIKLEFYMAVYHARERQLGMLDMVNQQPFPISPPRSGTHT